MNQRSRQSKGAIMSFTIVPRGRKPKPPIPLHRYMYRACRDIEHITRTALTCSPTDSWSQYLLTNIIRAMRNGADEMERTIELRVSRIARCTRRGWPGFGSAKLKARGGNHAGC